MLIRLDSAAGAYGIEHGLVRAADVPRVSSLQALQRKARTSANALIEQARGEAAQIVADAQTQADALHADAQVGIEQARRDAHDQAQRRALDEWHTRHAELALRRGRALSELPDGLAGIVTTAVERIVHGEDREALYRRALKVVQSLQRDALALTLRVNPADIDAARAGIAAITVPKDAGVAFDLASDASLAPGSALFESEFGVIDAGLQTQLDALREAMARAVIRWTAEEGSLDGGLLDDGAGEPVPADDAADNGKVDDAVPAA